MADDIAIKVNHVSKNFKLPHEKVDSVKSLFVNPFQSKDGLKTETQHALKDIDFEVKKGEFFGIVGRNGSGKSTLLKIIANIYQPTRGKVTVNGRLVPFIELGVGFNPELTGRENTYLNGALMGFSEKEVDAKYDEIVEFAELHRFMDQKLKNYSSGMQVRLAFSVATILAESDILLIDEVLAVGDADFQRKCFNYFKMLKRNKKTVVFVSHDMDAIREYCDRAVLIENCELIQSGTASKIASAYSRLFIENSDSADEQTNTRWGTQTTQFTKVTCPALIGDKDRVIDISVTIDARQKTDDLLLGFSIKTPDGRVLIATNTKILKTPISAMDEGENKTVVFKVPNIFSDGEYTVTLALESKDSKAVYDWWEDACKIRSRRERPTPALAHVDISVEA